MKILKFRSDDHAINIYIPTDTIDKYHSNSKSSTQIFCSNENYELPINTEELLDKIFVDNPDEFKIISIPFGYDSGFTVKKAMDFIE
ncbi:MAG: hypothetical protein ABI091_16705 [Ferruginibacter sp.]